MTLEEALTVMLGVPRGGEAVVEWLTRLPGTRLVPGRRRLLGADTPDTVTVGRWRVGPAPAGVRLQLVSGDVAVRTREESGRAAGALVADVVAQHAANLPPLQRDQLAAEVSALCEVTEAGSL